MDLSQDRPVVSKIRDFRSFWTELIRSTWVLGVALILLWSIPRFMLVLQANQTGSYQWIPLVFLSMWLTPWIFLYKSGRSNIGIRSPRNSMWLVYALILGGSGCMVMFMVAGYLYGDSISNWFVYIANSYSNVPSDLTRQDRFVYFIIYAVISMIFSPIGEELFYRGVVHHCFRLKWGHKVASIIDSAAFSITHLAHFGIVFYHGQWDLLVIPALVWMTLLFLVCLFFNYAKLKSGSILGAIIAHAGFNLAMIYFIFYHIM